MGLAKVDGLVVPLPNLHNYAHRWNSCTYAAAIRMYSGFDLSVLAKGFWSCLRAVVLVSIKNRHACC